MPRTQGSPGSNPSGPETSTPSAATCTGRRRSPPRQGDKTVPASPWPTPGPWCVHTRHQRAGVRPWWMENDFVIVRNHLENDDRPHAVERSRKSQSIDRYISARSFERHTQVGTPSIVHIVESHNLVLVKITNRFVRKRVMFHTYDRSILVLYELDHSYGSAPDERVLMVGRTAHQRWKPCADDR